MRALLAALLLLAALGGALGRPYGPDLAEFLPPQPHPRSAFLFRELRSGAATTLLAGIEGADQAELARLSRETAAGLRASGRFDFVGDGTTGLGEAEEQALLFRYRYLLSARDPASGLRRGCPAAAAGGPARRVALRRFAAAGPLRLRRPRPRPAPGPELAGRSIWRRATAPGSPPR